MPDPTLLRLRLRVILVNKYTVPVRLVLVCSLNTTSCVFDCESKLRAYVYMNTTGHIVIC